MEVPIIPPLSASWPTAGKLSTAAVVKSGRSNLGSVETRAGNPEWAQQLCDEALRLALEIENSLLATYCVINRAGVASARGEHTRGDDAESRHRDRYERQVERTRRALGEAEYEQAVQAGRELDRDAAIEYAIGG